MKHAHELLCQSILLLTYTINVNPSPLRTITDADESKDPSRKFIVQLFGFRNSRFMSVRWLTELFRSRSTSILNEGWWSSCGITVKEFPSWCTKQKSATFSSPSFSAICSRRSTTTTGTAARRRKSLEAATAMVCKQNFLEKKPFCYVLLFIRSNLSVEISDEAHNYFCRLRQKHRRRFLMLLQHTADQGSG